jgi:hypothetical protein
VGTVGAQDHYFYVALDVKKPTSNGWLESTSSRGGRIGYRGFLNNERFSAGVDFNWSQFDQYEPEQTFPNSTGAITIDYFKYIYQYGATVSGQYYFPLGDNEVFFPYAGLGLGANYNEYIIYYNIYSDGEKKWGFLARPEAGILVRFGSRRSIGAIASVHYDFSTNESPSFEISNFSAVGFQIGIMVMSW